MTCFKIIGIDPGSQITGFCVLAIPRKRAYSPRDFQILDAGVIKPKPSLTHGERAGQLHNSVYTIVEHHSPNICVIERAFTGINPLSALRLGETRGAIISAARRLDVPIHEITPTQVKKMITGQGHASKDQIARAVETIAGFHRGHMPFDVTDAVAIALTYGLIKPSQDMRRQHL